MNSYNYLQSNNSQLNNTSLQQNSINSMNFSYEINMINTKVSDMDNKITKIFKLFEQYLGLTEKNSYAISEINNKILNNRNSNETSYFQNKMNSLEQTNIEVVEKVGTFNKHLLDLKSEQERLTTYVHNRIGQFEKDSSENVLQFQKELIKVDNSQYEKISKITDTLRMMIANIEKSNSQEIDKVNNKVNASLENISNYKNSITVDFKEIKADFLNFQQSLITNFKESLSIFHDLYSENKAKFNIDVEKLNHMIQHLELQFNDNIIILFKQVEEKIMGQVAKEINVIQSSNDEYKNNLDLKLNKKEESILNITSTLKMYENKQIDDNKSYAAKFNDIGTILDQIKQAENKIISEIASLESKNIDNNYLEERLKTYIDKKVEDFEFKIDVFKSNLNIIKNQVNPTETKDSSIDNKIEVFNQDFIGFKRKILDMMNMSIETVKNDIERNIIESIEEVNNKIKAEINKLNNKLELNSTNNDESLSIKLNKIQFEVENNLKLYVETKINQLNY